MLYAAASLSLACLEILVHIRDTSNIPDLTFTEIQIPDKAVEPWLEDPILTTAILESDVLSREFGDMWATRKGGSGWRLRHRNTFPVHAVPSAIIPVERNYLINPAHDLFARISWGVQRPFSLDPRLIDPALR